MKLSYSLNVILYDLNLCIKLLISNLTILKPKSFFQKMRKFLLTNSLSIGILFILSFFSTPALIHSQNNNKPNIVIALMDDMGYSDLGCYGGENNTTPNIDRIAQNGIRFTNFYNAARCCPTRASFLTGLYQHQTGIGLMSSWPEKPDKYDYGIYGYRGFLNRDCVTMAEVLKDANYGTYITGKWHIGSMELDQWPLQRGFDRFYGIVKGECDFFEPDHNVKPGNVDGVGLIGNGLILDNNKLPKPNGNPNGGYYTTNKFTDYALDFIDDHFNQAGDDKPLFLYLAYTAPHSPIQAQEQDIQKFRGDYLIGWDQLRQQRYQKQKNIGLIDDSQYQLSERDPEVPAWNSLSSAQKQIMDERMATYTAMIHCADYNIARIEQKLKDLGEWNNTLFVLFSDNGGSRAGADPFNDNTYVGKYWANASNTPFRRFKRNSEEGGIVSPLILHWPDGITQNLGGFNRTPMGIIDLMPTILEISEAQYPQTYHGGNSIHHLEGKSLVSVLDTSGSGQKEYMFWEHDNNRAVRHGDWKAVTTYLDGSEAWELYDLNTDGTEMNNLASQNPDLVNQLVTKWYEWAIWNHVIPRDTSEVVNGINYSYYEGDWSSIPDLSNLQPKTSGLVRKFDTIIKERNNDYAVKYTGKINIDKKGDYTFSVNTDGDVRLYVNNSQVINENSQSGTININSIGKKNIQCEFYQLDVGSQLIFKWNGPDFNNQQIPINKLFPASTVKPVPGDDDDDDNDNDDNDNDDDNNDDDNDDDNAPVTLFGNQNYTGAFSEFDVGTYEVEAFEAAGDLNRNDAESIRVLPGYQATLHQFKRLNGLQKIYTTDSPDLEDFNNITASLTVTYVGDDDDDDDNDDNNDDDNNDNNDDNNDDDYRADAVELWSNADYKGNVALFTVGDYDQTALVAAGMNNNDAHSIKVLPGYEATIFTGANFDGQSKIFTEDAPRLGGQFSNQVSSIKVRYIGN